MKKLTNQELESELADLPNWRIDESKLFRELTFSSFAEAFSFMTRVALHCEKRDHHPEWHNVGPRVRIWLTTHDVGGVSAADTALARVVDELGPERN